MDWFYPLSNELIRFLFWVNKNFINIMHSVDVIPSLSGWRLFKMDISKFGKKYSDELYFLFRVFVGLLFAQHGAQKLFGWFGGSGSAQLFSVMGFAGVVEFFGGLALALGLFTRLAAFLGFVVMVGAQVQVHLPQGLVPILNKGELSLLYLAAFLVLFAYGPGKWSLGHKLFKKEVL